MRIGNIIMSIVAAACILLSVSCSTTENDRTDTMEKIDMSAWSYNSETDVYYQVGIQYVSNPAAADYENLGIYVPGAYFNAVDNGDGTYTVTVNKDAEVAGFDYESAPYVMPIQTPGYSELQPPTGYAAGVEEFTSNGFILVYAGARGRNEGAPAGVTDFKAAIRYIRYNSDILPGDTDRYFTYGMSGGGAQSAILGASGDAPEYEEYLEAIGAVMDESDAVMGSMDWCPITNLNVADAAYEWELGVARENLDSGTQALSDGLAVAFAEYINSLGLKDENGNVLSLVQSEDGLYHDGTYYEYLKRVIETSLNNFLSDTTFPYSTEEQKAALGNTMMRSGDAGRMAMPPREMNIEEMDGINRAESSSISGTYNSVEEYIAALNQEEEWVIYDPETNTAAISSVEAFMRNAKQLQKNVGAFDDLAGTQGENILFGHADGSVAHFDSIMAGLLAGTEKGDEYAESLTRVDALGNSVEERVNMYNPMYYLSDHYDGYRSATVAKYWRIHAGIFQGDTAISTEMDYYLALANYGTEVESVEFEEVWGLYHVEAERSGKCTANFISWVKECLS